MIFDWLEYYLRFLSLEIFIFIERIHKGRKNIRGIYVKNYCMYHFFLFSFYDDAFVRSISLFMYV